MFYPASKIEGEIFDYSPLVGSTSLPLSGPAEKMYEEFYENSEI